VAIAFEGLQHSAWNSEQLAEISNRLSRYDPVADLAFGMESDRGWYNRLIDRMLSSGRTDVPISICMDQPHIFFHAPVLRAFPGIVRRNQLRLNRYLADRRARLDVGNGWIKFDHPLADDTCSAEEWTDYYLLFYLTAETYDTVDAKAALAAATQRLAVIACALERHRLAHGAFPAELAALVPALLTAVPHEPYGMEPLLYRRGNDTRYLLYSRGEDRVDDGGKSMLPEKGESTRSPLAEARRQPDWVWARESGE
jgi:hypothetical protein